MQGHFFGFMPLFPLNWPIQIVCETTLQLIFDAKCRKYLSAQVYKHI